MSERNIPPYCIDIDSRDRDQDHYSNANSYVVHLSSPIEDPCRINLIHAIYPKSRKNDDDIYVNMHVKLGYKDRNISDKISNHTMVIHLPLLNAINEFRLDQTGGIIDIDRNKKENGFGTTMKNHHLTLTYFQIEFRTYDKKLYDMRDHFLKFQVF